MRRPTNRQPGRVHRGQTLVLFALAQLVLLSALGLAIDGGFLYVQRRAMQNAADAAAMAGAQAISLNQTDTAVTAAVIAAAARNGVTDPAQVTCKFITNSYTSSSSGPTQPCNGTLTVMSALGTAFTGVEVRAAERHATFVLRAVGTPEAGTAATAAAQVQTAGKITVGPFVVCAIDTAVYSAPSGYNSGGIFEKNGNMPTVSSTNYTRIDGYDTCGGGLCGRAKVASNGGPQVNANAYAYADAGAVGGTPSGPVFLIHAPNGISVCNDNSSSFKGINTNTTVVAAPNGQGYWAEYNNPPASGAFAPVITTGNVSSVQSTVEGINGCVAGAALDNCIMILPIVDNSGPGGTGSNAALAWRMLGAFYIKEISNGKHTGALIDKYTIVGDGSATWVPGARVPTTITLIK